MNLIFHILAVCGTAVFTGFLLTTGLVFGGYWQSLTPTELLDWFSKHLNLFARPAPILLVALTGLAGSLFFDWTNVHQRYYWIASLLCMVLLLIITFTINGPMNTQFAAKAIEPDHVPSALNKWLTAHWIRTALGVIASVLSVIAVNR